MDLDIMVTRKFLSIDEVIQLAKYNSIINAHLERPKLKYPHMHHHMYIVYIVMKLKKQIFLKQIYIC